MKSDQTKNRSLTCKVIKCQHWLTNVHNQDYKCESMYRISNESIILLISRQKIHLEPKWYISLMDLTLDDIVCVEGNVV